MKILCTVALVLLALLASPAAATPGTSPTLVTFEQTGGFAGIERGMSVLRSGKVVSDGLPVTASQLSSTRLALLRTRLVAAQWATLRAKYEPETPISDGYVYKITYAGRTIRIEEGASSLPLRLKRPFVMLRSIAGLTG
jgi:hypothetical protein